MHTHSRITYDDFKRWKADGRIRDLRTVRELPDPDYALETVDDMIADWRPYWEPRRSETDYSDLPGFILIRMDDCRVEPIEIWASEPGTIIPDLARTVELVYCHPAHLTPVLVRAERARPHDPMICYLTVTANPGRMAYFGTVIAGSHHSDTFAHGEASWSYIYGATRPVRDPDLAWSLITHEERRGAGIMVWMNRDSQRFSAMRRA